MKTKRVEDEARKLTGIRRAFARQRQSGLGVGRAYPEHLRRLAVSALKAGHEPKVVADAAGVSPQSLWNWGRQVQEKVIAPAVKLRLINEDTGKVSAAVVPVVVAQIRFRTGAVMDIPVCALTAPLLAAFNGGSL